MTSDALSSVFTGPFLMQRLQFGWSEPVQFGGFGFDVATTTTPAPPPASVLLLAASLGGLGLLDAAAPRPDHGSRARHRKGRASHSSRQSAAGRGRRGRHTPAPRSAI
jgi:hypothetical protein